jgi:GNAT superfamily N-acetyltransferase
MEHTRADGYCVSDDPARLDREWVANWLAEVSYWATGRPRDVQDRAIDHSLCIGLYAPDGAQAGFCRFVTDRATFAWLCDVFVDSAHRAKGLGVFMLDSAIEHPDLAALQRHVLATGTAQDLYSRYGFVKFTESDAANWMIRR